MKAKKDAPLPKIGTRTELLPEEELRNKVISFMVNAEEKKMIDEYCKENGLGKSFLARMLFKRYGVI